LTRIGFVVLMAVVVLAAPAAAAGNGSEAVEATADRAAAHLIRAQATPDLRSPSSGQTDLSVADAATASSRLIMADAGQDRSARWDALATARGAPADSGQGNAMRAESDEDDDDDDAPPGVVPPAHTLTRPSAVALARSSLLVSDTFNHRLLVVRLL
jgi:hypothetical protein